MSQAKTLACSCITPLRPHVRQNKNCNRQRLNSHASEVYIIKLVDVLLILQFFVLSFFFASACLVEVHLQSAFGIANSSNRITILHSGTSKPSLRVIRSHSFIQPLIPASFRIVRCESSPKNILTNRRSDTLTNLF